VNTRPPVSKDGNMWCYMCQVPTMDHLVATETITGNKEWLLDFKLHSWEQHQVSRVRSCFQ
jgi:hypothetical protein